MWNYIAIEELAVRKNVYIESGGNTVQLKSTRCGEKDKTWFAPVWKLNFFEVTVSCVDEVVLTEGTYSNVASLFEEISGGKH